MEVQFTPEQEAQISQIAQYHGTPADQLVKQAALRMLDEDAEIRAGIQRGIEQADRGELIDHEEVVARFERLLQPK
jgi:predicted transcriptional regulator